MRRPPAHTAQGTTPPIRDDNHNNGETYKASRHDACPMEEIRDAQNEQIAFATIGIIAHAASRKHPWAPISSQAENQGNTTFPQVRYPYSTNITMRFWKDTAFRMSARASQKRLHTQPFERPAASRTHTQTEGGWYVHANGCRVNRGRRCVRESPPRTREAIA